MMANATHVFTLYAFCVAHKRNKNINAFISTNETKQMHVKYKRKYYRKQNINPHTQLDAADTRQLAFRQFIKKNKYKNMR